MYIYPLPLHRVLNQHENSLSEYIANLLSFQHCIIQYKMMLLRKSARNLWNHLSEKRSRAKYHKILQKLLCLLIVTRMSCHQQLTPWKHSKHTSIQLQYQATYQVPQTKLLKVPIIPGLGFPYAGSPGKESCSCWHQKRLRTINTMKHRRPSL